MKRKTATARATVRRTYANPRARYIGRIGGRNVYRFPVTVRCNDSAQLATVAELQFEVISTSATDAANWARDQFETRAETEVFAYGPKGGEVYRFIGWHTAIAAAMWKRCDAAVQLQLPTIGAEVNENAETILGAYK